MVLPDEIIALAHQLADVSAAVIRPYFRSPLAIDDKNDHSPVTIADKDAERVMRGLILQKRPQDGIIGEEFGREREDAEWVWVLDPIDGTKSFTVGRALFVTLIGLLHHGKPVLGIINQPVQNERWLGITGQGAWLNGEPVVANQIDQLQAARLGTTGPQYLLAGAAAFARLSAECRFTSYGGDGYLYAQVASGWLELVVEEGLKLHDFAALAPVVNGAGGMMTDWQGKTLDIHSEGQVLAAANPVLHAAALPFLLNAV
ncbi:inositol monophosphatase family protein [Iodobacter sp. HSC-16F04]|uniref:Inositol monophosphatase family protein n=1 Tax=Iodobacter violaceini TaxID=3044271 RepID=A0ABX0L044_9NEIS|nr:inositol monophosphatase family protein [Iodobacter violacea]NHQ87614.1 inositol monophosphatase family protein [Iodobacter violacea]